MKTQDIQLLAKLISFKSVLGNNEAIADCLKTIEGAFGDKLIVTRLQSAGQPMLLLSNVEGGRFDFILSGHIDVVPASSDERFVMQSDGGRLYGRGVIDMKGPLLAGMCAVRDFLEASPDTSKRIAILVSTDEETSGASMKALLDSREYQADFALLSDGGSENEIIVGQKGFLQLKISVVGKSAHASRPSEGVNPIVKVFELMSHLHSVFPQPCTKDDWKTSVVLTKINSGTAVNQIPEMAEACFDIRYVTNGHRQLVLDTVNNFLDVSGTCEIIAENSALEVDPDNVHVRKLSEAIKRVTGQKVEMKREAGTSDAVFFAENGTPATLFLPIGGGAHQEDEWVSEVSLQRHYQCILTFLESL